MITATNAGMTTNYLYNALGQRVKKSNTTGATYFVYDEQDHLLGEYDQSGTMIQEIVWLGDIPVATIRTDQGGSGAGVFYIHTDHLNSPTKITRSTDNQVIWRWDHDPYGNGTANQDPDGNGLQLTMNLRFPGQYFDPETGLLYNGFRDYDSATGRYVESDPIGLDGGSFSTYSYGGGNPISRTDPEGLSFGESAAMTLQWLSGTGASDRGFGPGSSPSAEMMNSPGVNAARKLYDQKNKDNCNKDCKDAQPVTNYKASFGLSGLVKSGLNPTEQFVGSYRVDIYPAPNCQKWIVITNTSSFKSFGYGLAPDWSRSTSGPMGNMSQTYWWIE